MATKKIKDVKKMVIPAGKAQMGPPLGSTLGPFGINLAQLCKEFNDATASMTGVVPAVITIYEDRSFSFVLKTPPVSELIKQSLGIKSGASDPLRNRVGTLSQSQLNEIASRKMEDLNCYDLDSAKNMVMGTCRSMGVKIEAA